MRRWRWGEIRGALVVVAMSIVQAACFDGNSSAGSSGPPVGPTPPPVSVTINITGVTTADRPVVSFTAVDQDDDPFPGIPLGSLHFIIAKLVPGTNGNADAWQSYLNIIEQPTVGPGTQPATQAVNENSGTLVDRGDGTYAYTFSFDINNVTSPVAVPFEPTLTHRVAIELSGGGFPAENATLDFVPAGGNVIEDRNIVATASCNQCHGRLAVHGGGRVETKYCVTCHNPGSGDANSGNTLDFKVMIHKIHRGENLPSVEAGGRYVLFSADGTANDFSDVVFPQDIRHCTKCHSASVPGTPQGDNWSTKPTMEACTACHDDVSFATSVAQGQRPHSGGPLIDNGACAGCHAPSGVADTVEDHAIFAEEFGKRFEYRVLRVANTAPGQTPTVTFQVLKDGAPSNILTDPEWTVAAGGNSRLAVLIGWNTVDYNNTGSGSSPGQPISINPLSIGPTPATDNGDGSFSVTSAVPIPATVVGSGVAALEGHPAATNPKTNEVERIPVTNAVLFFGITDPTPVPRRQIVDIAKCDQCHAVLSVHGENRTNEPQVCVICHNGNATDIDQRPASANNFADFAAVGVDGKREQAIHIKYMIHAIHASGPPHGLRVAGITVYGFGRSINSFGDVRFPGILSNCSTCHVGNTFEVPLPAGVLGTTVQTADPSLTDVTSIEEALANPDDNLRISPIAAACSACHDDDVSRGHMEQNGGAFAVTQASLDSGATFERCPTCHARGGVADVRVAHSVP